MIKISLFILFNLIALVGSSACVPGEAFESYITPPSSLLKPANISVAEVTANPPIASWDETITIKVKIVNSGDLEGTYNAVLKLNDKKQYETSVIVPGNSLKYVHFQLKGGLGDYNASVGEMNVGFTVVQPKTLPPVYVPPLAQPPAYQPPAYIPPSQDIYQLDELRRQQQQQQQELQKMQDQQKQQMRELNLGLAKQYDEMANALVQEYEMTWRPGESLDETIIRERKYQSYYRPLIDRYRQQASYYRSLAYSP